MRTFDLQLLFLVALLMISQSTLADKTIKVSSANSCFSCHAQQTLDWQTSDHAKAMQLASDASVLGDFTATTDSLKGHNVRFYRQGNAYRVSIAGRSWLINYTFGHYPLQQYLVETERGKKQVLPFAWDSRPKDQGGQQWIYLFDEVPADGLPLNTSSGSVVMETAALEGEVKRSSVNESQGHRFHWQQPLQNWNGMCADCHSSGLQRQYDPENDSFSSHWQDDSVSCLSCHVISDQDVQDNKHPANALNNLDKLASVLKRSAPKRQWLRKAEDKVASLVNESSTDVVMDNCFACHSLRTPLTDGFSAKTPFLDQFKPNWLFPPLYHVDGQIKEEVYVYGSFMQSKMHAAGVTCIDCHQPHSGKVKLPDNQLCSQCHASERYDNKAHHQHQDNAGAQCINCHMPETTYMKVDPRRDHSFKIPNLAFSRTMNTPLACDQCHSDKSDIWLEQQYQWKATHPKIQWQWSRWMQGENSQKESGDAQTALTGFLNMLENPELGLMQKASALAWLPFSSQAINLQRSSQPSSVSKSSSKRHITAEKISQFLRSEQPLMRLAATEAFTLFTADLRAQYLTPLLQDKVKAVRISAVQNLLDISPTHFTGIEQQKAWSAAFKELLSSSKQQLWRGEGRVNLADIYFQTERPGMAVEQLEQAIFIDPYYEVAYINLADIFRLIADESKVKHWLSKGITAIPDSGNLHFSMGLHLIRTRQIQQAVTAIEQAVQLSPDNWQFIYALSTLYEELGMTKQRQKLLESMQ